MGRYMAERIIKGVYTYEYVIEKRPDLKEDIDTYLIETGHEDLIPKKDETEEEITEDTPTILPIFPEE